MIRYVTNPVARSSLLLLLTLVACTDGDDYVRRVGVVDVASSTIPSTGTVNTPIAVTIITEGGSCLTTDSTDVVVDGDQVEITPFDLQRIPHGSKCTLIATNNVHAIDLTFATPGTKQLVIHGSDDQMFPFQLAVD